MEIIIRDLNKAELFAGLFQHMKLFTDNINIMFEQERMFIQTMDASHIAIVEINIPSRWFDEYNLNDNVSLTIGINSTILTKVLSTREKTQAINIKLVSEDDDKLFVEFASTDKRIFDKTFEIPLLDLEQEIMAIPDTEPQAEFSLLSLHFSGLINQLKLFGQNMDIECSEEKIVLNSITNDNGKMAVHIDNSELSEFSIDEGANLKLSFSLTYLHHICAYNKLSKEVKVRLTEDFPLQVVYSIGDDDAATMRFFLAPKINDEL